MCAALPVLMIASTAMAALGTGIGAIQQSQAAGYRAKVANANAKAESARARDAIARGKIDQQQLSRKYAAVRGEQEVAMAANGVDLGFGSASLTLQDTSMFLSEDSAALARNNLNEVQGIDMSAANFRSEAGAARQAQSGAIVGGIFGMGATALSGATQYATMKAKLPGAVKFNDYGRTGLPFTSIDPWAK